MKNSDGWLSLVEGTGFENRRRGNSTGGSNPSPSAFSLMIALGTRDPCPAFTFSAPPANLGWAASNRTEKVLTVSGKELGIIITKMDFGRYFFAQKDTRRQGDRLSSVNVFLIDGSANQGRFKPPDVSRHFTSPENDPARFSECSHLG